MSQVSFPKDFLQHLRESRGAQDLLYDLLLFGEGTVDDIGLYERLEELGVVRVKDRSNGSYGVKIDSFYFSSVVKSHLAEAVVFAQLGSPEARLLHESLGKQVRINDSDGVLVVQNGLYHISENFGHNFGDGDDTLSRMIVKTRLRPSGLRAEGDQLSYEGDMSHSYFFKGQEGYMRLTNLLRESKRAN
ncbi:hypothetical protein ACFLZX_05055 [Nanoarchaeota archaeon]